jgi:hypothetical protein
MPTIYIDDPKPEDISCRYLVWAEYDEDAEYFYMASSAENAARIRCEYDLGTYEGRTIYVIPVADAIKFKVEKRNP